jgi:dGTP triphosphohydrolase
MTRQVRIIGKSMDKVVRLDRIKIYFTGYKDLCPGIQKGGTCTYSSKNASTKCSNSKCRFWWGKTKYPDINRLIRFQDHMLDLDMELKNLISNIIHKSSRVARMNYMGEKIIRFLLDSYLKNPRLMHDRVWSRLRIYQEKENVDHAIREWVDKPVSEKENAILPEQVLNCLTDLTRRNKNANHFSLVRRVVEHVAGMTDRYISNEYNRLNQSGRETEKQDETYFFY